MLDNYDVEVRLLAITGLVSEMPRNPGAKKKPDCEEIIEYSGRLCWDTIDKLGTNPDRIQEWIRIGHESVIEHSSATFLVKASRVLTHELVRHRLASYSQRSQRYVKESKPKYIMPPEVRVQSENSCGMEVFEEAMKSCWIAYNQLLSLGVKREIARYVLPNACETQIVMTMNFRELRHFIKLRTSKRALPEMRAVACEIKRIIKEKAPSVFSDL